MKLRKVFNFKILCILTAFLFSLVGTLYSQDSLRIPIGDYRLTGLLAGYLLTKIPKGHESEVKSCLALLESYRDALLEIGCGDGITSWLIASEYPNIGVIATDQFNVHKSQDRDAIKYDENRRRYENFTLDCQIHSIDNFIITRAESDIIETLPSEVLTYLLVVNPALGLEEDLINRLVSIRRILKPGGKIFIIPHHFSDRWMEDATYVESIQCYMIKGFELVISNDPVILGVDVHFSSEWTSSGRVLTLTKKMDIFSDIALLKEHDQLLGEDLKLRIINAIAKILGFEYGAEAHIGSHEASRLHEILSKTRDRLREYETIFDPIEYKRVSVILEECEALFRDESFGTLRELIGIAKQAAFVINEDISTGLLRLLGFTNNTHERQTYLEEEIKRPLSITRVTDDIEPGTHLSLYEVLRRDYGDAINIWRKVGLEEEFRKVFPDEKSFWQSDKSLMIIYSELKEIQQESYKTSLAIKNLRRNI